MSEKTRHAIVFCDFDGTISASETFVGVLKQFAPTLASEMIPKILSKEISIRDGVTRIIQSISSSIYPNEMLDFVKDKPIRLGLSSLIDYLDSRGIPFVVVSGGFRCLVEDMLEREGLLKRCAQVYAIDIDRNNEFLNIISQWKSETELVAKVNVINHERRGNEKIIVIGDSITDLNAAKCADIVFVRDLLCKYLIEEKISFYEWNDFYDIQKQLEQIEN